jgi:hypothetical protein
MPKSKSKGKPKPKREKKDFAQTAFSVFQKATGVKPKVRRSNLTMRMSMRRFTRLTNGFSKKLENHEHALALYFMYYNFCRIHQTLRVTPAMEAGVADHVWSIEEILALLRE